MVGGFGSQMSAATTRLPRLGSSKTSRRALNDSTPVSSPASFTTGSVIQPPSLTVRRMSGSGVRSVTVSKSVR